MTSISARIDELQKQLVIQQIAEAEQKRKKNIAIGSIEQLEEFCNMSDKILDNPHLVQRDVRPVLLKSHGIINLCHPVQEKQ